MLGKSQHRVHHTLEIDDEIEVYIVRVDEKMDRFIYPGREPVI